MIAAKPWHTCRILGWSPTIPVRRSHRDQQQHRRANHSADCVEPEERFLRGARCRRELGHHRITHRTCKLNSVDPLAYMTATLTAIVNGHKQSQIDRLLPWDTGTSYVLRRLHSALSRHWVTMCGSYGAIIAGGAGAMATYLKAYILVFLVIGCVAQSTTTASAQIAASDERSGPGSKLRKFF